MSKQILFLIFALQFTTAFSQAQLIKDNRTLDSLTKSMKTYQINMFVNDNISNDGSIVDIRHELENKFQFLKQKKRTKINPDFNI
jgi:hypothetical protein